MAINPSSRSQWLPWDLWESGVGNCYANPGAWTRIDMQSAREECSCFNTQHSFATDSNFVSFPKEKQIAKGIQSISVHDEL